MGTRIVAALLALSLTAASAEAKRPAELTTALARGYVEPGQPRVFSPDQPLFVAPTETQRPSGRAAAPVRTAQAVTSEMRVASDSAVRTLPPIEPRAVDAVQPRLQPERPSVQSGNRAQPVKPKDEDGKSALVRDLQRELKRVGCYDGEISGSWSAATRRAMSTFIERVNATLPVEQPDFILLTLVQGSQPSACAAKCASDQAIGDGDHGINMKRGCEAVLEELDALAGQSLPDALKAIGTQLVMKVGGASGPLYGTLFLTLGKELPASPDLADVERAFAKAIEAVKARGKSDVGYKTMLDVLIPLQATLAAGGDDVVSRVRETAAAAAQSTIPMLALRGRASFLGERSIGHMDPGSRSAQLIAEAVCDVIEGKA